MEGNRYMEFFNKINFTIFNLSIDGNITVTTNFT